MTSKTGFEKQKIRRAFLEIEQLKRALIQEVLLSLGLTPGHGQARTLMALLRLESASQKELAVECLLDVTTMSRTLDRLQNMGLVERRRDPMSRRTFRVSLTEEGKKLAEKVTGEFSKIDEDICRDFSDEELEAFLLRLEKVRENLR